MVVEAEEGEARWVVVVVVVAGGGACVDMMRAAAGTDAEGCEAATRNACVSGNHAYPTSHGSYSGVKRA